MSMMVSFVMNEQNIYLRLPKIYRPDGGTGRRAGLKNQWAFAHAGSIPAPGTNYF